MSDDMLALLDGLDDTKKIVKAPFNWAGGKGRSLEYILPRLPERKIYVEPFGGSGVVLLNRRKSKCEVFNDAHSGVTAFYKCIRHNLDALIDRLELTVHSREEFLDCHSTWRDTNDSIERAAKWYYSVAYSFGGLGRNFGRNTTGGLSGKIRRALPAFEDIHKRFADVTIENSDWLELCESYDSPDTVFYLDPPYLGTYSGMGYDTMSVDDHKRLIEWALSAKGFVAISGYANPIYDCREWDNVFSWDVSCSLRGAAYNAGSGKEDLKHIDTGRGTAEEKLWIRV